MNELDQLRRFAAECEQRIMQIAPAIGGNTLRGLWRDKARLRALSYELESYANLRDRVESEEIRLMNERMRKL